MTEQQPILQLSGISKVFDISGGYLDQLRWQGGRPIRKKTIVHAVNNVSMEIWEGETLSVVGESGCGKSTLARTVIGLYPPDEGRVLYRGERIDNLGPSALLPYRTRMQMVFQDPYASLNPRMRVREILEEPIRFHQRVFNQARSPYRFRKDTGNMDDSSLSLAVNGKNGSGNGIKERVAEVMRQVGVDPGWADRFPHEFSGGQRQRISIARALMVDPEFIIADEPISALDVSIQAQILNLFMDAQEERGLTYLFISHDLSVIRHISTRVAVMYLGTVCELAPTEVLFETPRHPYTRALLSAIPKLGAPKHRHVKLTGEVPTPINLPDGCVFQGRCNWTADRCRRENPSLLPLETGAKVACHGVEEGRI